MSLLLLLLSLLLVVSGASVPDPTSSIPRLPWVANRVAGDIGWRARQEHENGRGMAGGVSCHNGKPHLEPQERSLVGLERDENRRHEAMHVEQFAPGCDSIMQLWNSEPFYRLELEAIATCYGLEVWGDSLYHFRKGLAITRISAVTGNAVGIGDIYAALDRHCLRGERGGA